MNHINKIAIFGASGHGKVVADIALLNGWDEIDFFDDAWPGITTLEHWDVIGSFDDLLESLVCYSGVIVAIGNNSIREKKLLALKEHGAKIVSLIHPCASVSQFAKLGSGTVIVGGAVINAFASVGVGCIINTGATVGHDCYLSSCVHIAPGANIAGNVEINRCCWIGVGSAIRQGIKLEDNVVVGAGAAVIKDVFAGQTVVGVPARVI